MYNNKIQIWEEWIYDNLTRLNESIMWSFIVVRIWNIVNKIHIWSNILTGIDEKVFFTDSENDKNRQWFIYSTKCLYFQNHMRKSYKIVINERVVVFERSTAKKLYLRWTNRYDNKQNVGKSVIFHNFFYCRGRNFSVETVLISFGYLSQSLIA